MAVSQQQVFDACDQIFAQGRRPRIEAVRGLLGSGSFSTIGKYIKLWQLQNQDLEPVLTEEEDLPQEIYSSAFEALKPVISRIWERANEQVNQERLATLESENELLQQQTIEIAGLKSANQELLKQIQELSGQLALAKAGIGIEDSETFQALQEKLEQATIRNQELERIDRERVQTNEELRNRLQSLEEVAAEVSSRNTDLFRENQELKKSQARLIEISNELIDCRNKAAQLEEQLREREQGQTMTTICGEVVHCTPPIAQMLEVERSQFESEIARLKLLLAEQTSEVATPEATNLTPTELANRLGVTAATLAKHRDRDLAAWSAKKDPDAVAWVWDWTLESYCPRNQG